MSTMKRLLAILLLALCIVPAIEARHMSDLKIYIDRKSVV